MKPVQTDAFQLAPTPASEPDEREKWNARKPDDFDRIAHEMYGFERDQRRSAA